MARTTALGATLLSGSRGKERAEQRLRADIAQGVVVPGQHLVEAELGQQYRVTRSSVRLAIDALMGDGLVERIANRGARVRTVSVAEAVAIMECRMVLDGLLCSKAAQTATAKDLARLQANLERMEQAVAQGDLLQYTELIQQHHALVADSARHPVARSLVERLDAQIVRHQFQLSLRPKRAHASLDELRRVVSAIVARDPAQAEQAGRAHLRGVIAALMEESGG